MTKMETETETDDASPIPPTVQISSRIMSGYERRSLAPVMSFGAAATGGSSRCRLSPEAVSYGI